MYRFVILGLSILFISSLKVSAQLDSLSRKTFSGTIIEDSLGYAIPSVHLWNESTRMGTVSNSSGEFRIKARAQDTLVFSAIGYFSQVMLVSSSQNEGLIVRLKQKTYEIDELVVRRFHSYQSFIYQVVHHEVPESELSEMKEHMDITLTLAALKADWERNAKEKLENPGFSSPLGPLKDPNKAFREKTLRMEKRRRIIESKFNRTMVGELTQLEGEDLTDFIALCNFSEDYLYKTDLPTIIEDMYALLDDYHSVRDTIMSDTLQ
jgi:hypothetical protein